MNKIAKIVLIVAASAAAASSAFVIRKNAEGNAKALTSLLKKGE